MLDVLLNPDVLLIRGYCAACKKKGTYKVVDIEALRREHEAIAAEEAASAAGPRSPRTKLEEERAGASVANAEKHAEVAWKWELLQSQPGKPKDTPDR